MKLLESQLLFAGVACAVAALSQSTVPCGGSMPYIPPGYVMQATIYPFYNVATGTVSFTCNNLAVIPALGAAFPNCLPTVEGMVNLPAGTAVFFGAQIGGSLHIGLPGPIQLLCSGSPCAQDTFGEASATNEYAVAVCTAGVNPGNASGGCSPVWTGYPALPAVTTTGCGPGAALAGYPAIMQSPTAVMVTCH